MSAAKALRATEIKALVPAKDFALSKRFFADLGFTQCSEGGGVASFSVDGCAFLLQDFYEQALADNLCRYAPKRPSVARPSGAGLASAGRRWRHWAAPADAGMLRNGLLSVAARPVADATLAHATTRRAKVFP